MNNFDLSSNLHLIFFGLLLLIDIFLFHWGLFTLLLAKGETRKMQKGRRLLIGALVFFFIIILIILVFYSITYFLKGGEVFTPSPEVLGGFPNPSHIGSIFPPGPEFIKIGIYYFMGPKLLIENENINASAVYSVLCKKDEEYDIMYIGKAVTAKLSDNEQYGCWIKSCDQKINNLYLAVLPIKEYNKRERIKNSLEDKFNPSCLDEVITGN